MEVWFRYNSGYPRGEENTVIKDFVTVSWEGSHEELQRRYRRRWLIWLVAVLAHTIGTFNRAAMAPMVDRLMADFEISAVAFGSLGAVYFYTYAIMQLPSGTLADTLGPRKTIVSGLLLAALRALLMSAAPSFSLLYAGRLIVSLGVSVTWVSIMKIIMEWFRSNEVATVTGYSSAIAHLGQLAASTPLALLIIWGGWRISFVAIAGVSLGLAIIGWMMIRNKPADIGLPPVSELENKTGKVSQIFEDTLNISLGKRFKMVVGDRRIWLLFLIGFGAFGAFATLFHNWTVIYIMQSYELTRDFASTFIFIATIGFMIGALLIGLLSDRVMKSRRRPALIFTSLLLGCLLVLSLWNGGRPPLPALYPLSLFIGIGGSVIPVIFGCVRDIVRPATRGIAIGLVNMGGFAGAAIAQPLFGFILDSGWQGKMVDGVPIYPLQAFQNALFLCCALAALGVLGALLMKETHCRPVYLVENS